MAGNSIPELERAHLDASRDQAEASRVHDDLRRAAEKKGLDPDEDDGVREARIVLMATHEIWIRRAMAHLDALEAERANRAQA